MEASTTDAAWEAAYLRFETPQQEQEKFIKRLRSLGVETWDRGLTITELFCGRGNGLIAWQRLGFEIERQRAEAGPARIMTDDF